MLTGSLLASLLKLKAFFSHLPLPPSLCLSPDLAPLFFSSLPLSLISSFLPAPLSPLSTHLSPLTRSPAARYHITHHTKSVESKKYNHPPFHLPSTAQNMTTAPSNNAELVSFANELADSARKVILPFWRQQLMLRVNWSMIDLLLNHL